MFLKKQHFILLIVLGSSLFVFLTLEGVGYYLGRKSASEWKPDSFESGIGKKDLRIIQTKNRTLQRRIERLSPLEVYIVIDSANNLLYLKKGLNTIREAVISCGSGNILEEPGGRRRWVFDTPRGVFEVKSKLVGPYWLKPDWAFIEEGEKIPKELKDRIEAGVLGDYALGFGDGYFIHGTLYTRLLGRNVTHGCIRIGDEDLKVVYTASLIGTKVFIF
jgi:L,D-transpeptidase YbiS